MHRHAETNVQAGKNDFPGRVDHGVPQMRRSGWGQRIHHTTHYWVS
jgi:hypothetical protein